jgi:hypothetical protein
MQLPHSFARGSQWLAAHLAQKFSYHRFGRFVHFSPEELRWPQTILSGHAEG